MRVMSSWGRLQALPHRVRTLTERTQVAELLGRAAHAEPAAATASPGAAGIAHGMGRSYGDVCLNGARGPGLLWHTIGLDRLIAFDPNRGVLTCEAGVLLRDIQRLMLPRGWLLAVTPGTQWITVGGAIANDVHGKNHHAFGTFGDHVLALELARTDGALYRCSPGDHAALFRATLGGLGLTGVIVTATLQLRRVAGPWLEVESEPFGVLDEFFALAAAAADPAAGWEHTVAWIDCLDRTGRGVFQRARPSADPGPAAASAAVAGAPRALPFTPPISLVNRASLRAFNALYYGRARLGARRSRQHHEAFSYPLDQIRDWNRIYGPRGFYQYQCVVPAAVASPATHAMLEAIAASGLGSFLAVLKTFGDRPCPGLLGFPMAGATLALDFPNTGAATLRLFDTLDAIVAEAGGRLYAAKDARMPRALFAAGQPNLAAFHAWRDPGMASDLSRRLLDD